MSVPGSNERATLWASLVEFFFLVEPIIKVIVHGLLVSRVKICPESRHCLNVAQSRINRVPNETRTHSCRFASLAS